MEKKRIFKIEYILLEKEDKINMDIKFKKIGRLWILKIIVSGIKKIKGWGWFKINFIWNCESLK